MAKRKFVDEFEVRIERPNVNQVRDYDAFPNKVLLDELRNPVMGKSDFQVGHMNPLKFDSVGEESGKHEASNIGWISADGNRIQGSMSLTGTRNMIKKIKQKYDGLGW